MIELKQLEQLITIVEEKTISQAAEKLLISQPALSRSMKNLEDDLGVMLFNRTKNKISLNENGKFAYKKAKKLVEDATKFHEELIKFDQNNYMSNLASCAPAPIWAIEKLFHYKNLTSQIIPNSNDMIAGLENNTYSLIILNHYIERNHFICVPLFSEKLYLSVVPEHHLAQKTDISFKELNGESIILSSRIGFWSELSNLNLPDSKLLYQDDRSALEELISASTLPTFKTDITIQMLKDNLNRIYIPIRDPEATMNYYLYFKKTNQKRYSFIKTEIEKIDWKDIAKNNVIHSKF